MREFKFRAWDVFYSQMVHSNETLSGLESFWRMVRRGEEAGREVPVMQFTGLRDKNGREIYEGDVVKPSHNYHHSNSDVYFDEHYAAFFIRGDDGEAGYVLNKSYCLSEVEVIGNIYENPGLLN